MDIGFDVEHPGIVLWEEYLQPLSISQSRFSRDVHISYPHAELLDGKRALTPDTALRLASYLGTSAEFWINWQGVYDLQQTIKRHENEYRRIERFASHYSTAPEKQVTRHHAVIHKATKIVTL